MLNLKLQRLYPKPNYIIGKFYIESDFFSDTMELPWRDNQENISCIPAGIYPVEMLMSPHFGRMLPHILNVPDRTDVMMHNGSFPQDTNGCVLVGKNSSPGMLTLSRIHSDSLNMILANETAMQIQILDVVA